MLYIDQMYDWLTVDGRWLVFMCMVPKLDVQVAGTHLCRSANIYCMLLCVCGSLHK